MKKWLLSFILLSGLALTTIACSRTISLYERKIRNLYRSLIRIQVIQAYLNYQKGKMAIRL